jgi:DNA-binding transcriptional ArsR family regulator
MAGKISQAWKQIEVVLKDRKRAGVAEIQEATGLRYGTVTGTLKRRKDAGIVEIDEDGLYRLRSKRSPMGSSVKAGYGNAAEQPGRFGSRRTGPGGLAVVGQHIDYEVRDADGNVRYRIWVLLEAADTLVSERRIGDEGK